MKKWRSWMGMMGMACLAAGLFAQPHSKDNNIYHRADSVAAMYAGYSLADVRDLSLKLTIPLSTERDKYRALFRWVCENIRSDYKLYHKVKKLRTQYQSDPLSLAAWNQKISKEIFTHLRKKRATICTGYAYLLSSMAQHAGLTCRIVNGYARNARANLGGRGDANHSWNAIRIGDEWYFSDPTWASGSVRQSEGTFMPYFLVQPSQFAHSHYPLDTTQLLLREKPSLTAFLNAPLAYAASYYYGLTLVTPREFFVIVPKEQPFAFVVKQESGNLFQTLVLKINDTEVAFQKVNVSDSAESTYRLTHTFTASGLMAAHLLADGKLIYSYQIKVK
jgi:hypothetical protein